MAEEVDASDKEGKTLCIPFSSILIFITNYSYPPLLPHMLMTTGQIRVGVGEVNTASCWGCEGNVVGQ